MAEEIINKIASSQLVQIDLDDYYYSGEIISYDLSQNLEQGLILRENDFRDFLKSNDWEQYRDKKVNITCETDAIIPNWTYMLLASVLENVNADYHFGSAVEMREALIKSSIDQINLKEYKDKMVLLKGCGSADLSPAIYVHITKRLQPIVKSLMFGEACSTVPVFKRKS